MQLRDIKFSKSCYQLADMPDDAGFEVCFIGRSNVGKSSLINALFARKKIAKTSKTPGRTQCLNVYDLCAHARLIDCPGYGFAKVDQKMRAHWQQLMQSYFKKRHSLVCVYWIMDARHPLNNNDKIMLQTLSTISTSVVVLLNKIDALNRDEQNRLPQDIAKKLAKQLNVVKVLAVSANEKIGLDSVAEHMIEVLAIN